ncbi:MAG: exodeoxyribonuclease V subunit beta [bacterium]
MNCFDLLDSPLEGRTLIEASAGTGKTYTIAGLYLRLLLEKRLSVDQILVVTFTVAATEELRSRIRRRIHEALSAFATGSSDDDFLAGLVNKVENRREARLLLTNALRCFDEAAVFTIHGFCQRVLQERAFECSSLFDTELVTDQSALVQEVVDDFWRIHVYNASPLFISFARERKKGEWSPDALAAFARSHAAKPNLRIIPDLDLDLSETRSLEDAAGTAFDRFRMAWPQHRDQVEELLSTSRELNRKQYPPDSIREWVEGIDNYLAAGNLLPWYEKLEKFGISSLENAAKKGCQAPRHPVFILADELCRKLRELEAACERQLVILKKQLLAFVCEELPKRKQELNIRSFDDLLLSLQDALQGGEGCDLARVIREKYQAALIDEFQDTDPVQYAIFKTIYPDGKNTLFLIGDPKQAIYSFRGADIFAYLEAAKDVEARYTLGTNWRSSPGLIKAVNTLFSNRDNPFIFEDIPFHPVSPPPVWKNEMSLMPESRPDYPCRGHLASEPLQLWFLGRGNQGRAINRGDAERELPEVVASEIGRLLEAGQKGEALIEGQPVAPGDIAVLTRTNRQARSVQEALQRRKIPSVLYSSESLFASREAAELLGVLNAVAEPGHEEKIRAALVTDMMGVSGSELATMLDDSTAWGMWLDKFRAYHELWARRRQGFMIMASTLTAREKIKSRLLAYPDGERRVTNFLHCLEVLHQAALENSFGIEGLLKWFARQLNDQPEKEEYQIRLETDEKAVKLVTIHKSKGLEYPIVFCPYTWSGLREEEDAAFFHDPENGWQPTLALGSQNCEQGRSLAGQEMLAENLRLLYVALTRAKYRCYLVWGAIRGAETSAPAYLFHPCGNDGGAGKPVEAAAARMSSLDWGRLDDRRMLDDLDALAQKAGSAIRVCAVPDASTKSFEAVDVQEAALSCRTFSGTISDDWRIASFSSLVAGKEEWWESPGLDENHPPEEIQEREVEEMEPLAIPHGTGQGPSSAGDFPTGSKAGTCLHDILEHLDFAERTPDATEKLVGERLSAHGFDLTLVRPLCSLLERVLATPLVDGRRDFTLSSLPRSDRVEEMEFYFPLERITAQGLSEIFASHGGPEPPGEFPGLIGKVGFTPTRGLLKGYIDLVFRFDGRYYLADYKSNYLGPRLEDYAAPALAEVMKREYYILQYHLYALALHKYLARRMPDYDYQTHFGGVFYLFLRGMSPAHGPRFGIYQDRPSEALINGLDHYLCGQGELPGQSD